MKSDSPSLFVRYAMKIYNFASDTWIINDPLPPSAASPPHGGGDASEASEGGAHTPSRIGAPGLRKMSAGKRQILGIISDTHGLLLPEVLQVFSSVSLILHAGDIGSSEVLDGLRTLAPVVAVRGNNDKEPWANRIPEVEAVRAGAISIYMLHDVKEMKLKPPTAKVQ